MDGARPDKPLELRPGETDRFYFIFSRLLASGDLLTGTPTVTSDGVTVVGALRNSQPLTLDGVEYATDTVVYFDASGITLNDVAEAICTAQSTSGRILKQSMWIQGVAFYARSL